LEKDWPENLDGYRFERYIAEQQAGAENMAGRLDLVKRSLRKGLDPVKRFLRGALDLVRRSLRETLGRVRRSLRKKSQG
jgi:hypothetical protein